MILWKHQQAGLEMFKQNPAYAGLFFDVGTGKTRTAIECLSFLYSQVPNKLVPTLIISPLITLENWRRELMKYSDVNPENIFVLKGSAAQKQKTLLKAAGKILIMNYEGLLSDSTYEFLLKQKYEVLVGDELHYIKTHNSKRTKKIHELSKLASSRIGLTGTPVLNSMEDLWSQMFFLDHGKRLGNKFHYFKLLHFIDKNASMPSHIRFPNWVPKPESAELIKTLISDCTISVKKEDCLDLPPLVVKEIYCDVSGDQKKAYEDLKRDFVSYIGEAACVATLAITKALRMQQVLCGYMPLDSGDAHEFKDNPRLDALKDLVESLYKDHKIIIWANFKYNHVQIGKMLTKLGIEHVYLTGDQNQAAKEKSMAEFETNPKVRVCIGNQSVGIGVNLIASDVSIYYSRGFNLAHDIQSEARNYRAGSEVHNWVTRYNFVASGTLDEQVSIALGNKKEIGASLLLGFDLR